MGKPKVTIGIPVYNVDQYLVQCLQSAVKQDYENLEIIIVDDCSTDSSGYIIDEFAAKDDRIRVIRHIRNKKNSAGRNDIVREATGDFIYWLDGDDYLQPFAVSSCVDAISKHRVDIVKTAIFPDDAKYAGSYTRNEYMPILIPGKISSQIIGSLFKKELYTDIRHDENRNLSDYDTFPLLVDNAKRIAVIANDSYNYRVLRPGSVTEQSEGRFSGYALKAYMTNKRYLKYRNEFPKECELVLKQFAENACMANMCAEDKDDTLPVRDLMYVREIAVMASERIDKYQKWAYKQVINHSNWLPMIKWFIENRQQLPFGKKDKEDDEDDKKKKGKKKKKAASKKK